MLKFKIKLESCDEGGYIVSCPALPGCHSQGETVEEATVNIKEAIEGYLEELNEQVHASTETEKILEVAI